MDTVAASWPLISHTSSRASPWPRRPHSVSIFVKSLHRRSGCARRVVARPCTERQAYLKSRQQSDPLWPCRGLLVRALHPRLSFGPCRPRSPMGPNRGVVDHAPPRSPSRGISSLHVPAALISSWHTDAPFRTSLWPRRPPLRLDPHHCLLAHAPFTRFLGASSAAIRRGSRRIASSTVLCPDPRHGSPHPRFGCDRLVVASLVSASPSDLIVASSTAALPRSSSRDLLAHAHRPCSPYAMTSLKCRPSSVTGFLRGPVGRDPPRAPSWSRRPRSAPIL